jgi:DNA-binding LytR/AlgR family response regulator
MKILIVDDEPLALDLLRAQLAQIPDVEIVGEARDGDAAIEAATRLRPDLVILDIHMPYRDGLQAAFDLKAAHGRHVPAVIFSTAHADHAVDAFDLEAVDYLLKPVRLHRLRQAVDRMRSRQMRASVEGSEPALAATGFWAPTHAGRRIRVMETDILRIEAARDHVLLHTAQRSFLLRMTMAAIAQQITDPRLVRVHRSAFVRLDAVRAIIRRAKSFALELFDGTIVPVSVRHRAILDRITAAD